MYYVKQIYRGNNNKNFYIRNLNQNLIFYNNKKFFKIFFFKQYYYKFNLDSKRLSYFYKFLTKQQMSVFYFQVLKIL